jgi:hypothetical protein
MNFDTYITSNPNCFRQIFDGNLHVRETVEEKIFFVEEKQEVVTIFAGECDACSGRMIKWGVMKTCEDCEMTISA